MGDGPGKLGALRTALQGATRQLLGPTDPAKAAQKPAPTAETSGDSVVVSSGDMPFRLGTPRTLQTAPAVRLHGDLPTRILSDKPRAPVRAIAAEAPAKNAAPAPTSLGEFIAKTNLALSQLKISDWQYDTGSKTIWSSNVRDATVLIQQSQSAVAAYQKSGNIDAVRKLSQIIQLLQGEINRSAVEGAINFRNNGFDVVGFHMRGDPQAIDDR